MQKLGLGQLVRVLMRSRRMHRHVKGKGRAPARGIVERLECGKKAVHTTTEIVILTYALIHLLLTLGGSIWEHVKGFGLP